MKVERVGDATEIGKVARQATEQNQEQTPLNIQLTKLANLIGKAGLRIQNGYVYKRDTDHTTWTKI